MSSRHLQIWPDQQGVRHPAADGKAGGRRTGTAFGASGEGFLRCCYATAFDQIKEACNRMEHFVETLS